MNINKYIGTKIREFREKRNLTQEEIAEYLKQRHKLSQDMKLVIEKPIKIFFLN